MYSVNATVLERVMVSMTRTFSLPTFYLLPETQGIQNKEAAERIAKNIIDPHDNYEKVFIHVEEI